MLHYAYVRTYLHVFVLYAILLVHVVEWQGAILRSCKLRFLSVFNIIVGKNDA